MHQNLSCIRVAPFTSTEINLSHFSPNRQNTKDIHTLAQLISAYSLVDTDKAKSYPFHLTTV